MRDLARKNSMEIARQRHGQLVCHVVGNGRHALRCKPITRIFCVCFSRQAKTLGDSHFVGRDHAPLRAFRQITFQRNGVDRMESCVQRTPLERLHENGVFQVVYGTMFTQPPKACQRAKPHLVVTTSWFTLKMQLLCTTRSKV